MRQWIERALFALLVAAVLARATAPTYNASGQYNDEDGTASATVSYTATAGSNRLLEVYAFASDGSPAAHSGVTWNGTALTQRGTTLNIGSFARLSHWFLKEANFPGGAANIVFTAASGQGAIQLFWIVHENVDQTSPFSNASQATNTGSNAFTATVTVTATVDQAVTHCVFGNNGSPDVTSIAINTGTSRQEKENFAGLFCGGAAGTATSAGPSVTPSWTWTMTGGDDMSSWGMVGDALTYTAPPAGGSTPAFRSSLLGVGK